MIDDLFRNKIIREVKDPVVKNFWAVEYESYPKVFKTETISPIQNKVGQFLSTPLMRNILGQVKTKFDLLDIMDSGKILLLNLSKGKIGEDNSSLLGSLILSQLWLAAQRRTGTPEEIRKDFYVYVDELQAFATDEFPSILAEARKYRLNMAGLANQFVGQLTDHLRQSILGNAGTLVSFCLGSEDADIIAKEFYLQFTPENFQSLLAHNMYLKISVNGTISAPFSANSLPPGNRSFRNMALKIIKQSRQRYCSKQSDVSMLIYRWINR